MQYSVQSLIVKSAPAHYKPNETEANLRLDLCEKLYSKLAPWEVIATDGKFMVYYGLNIVFKYGEIDFSSEMKTRWPGKISIERWQNDKCVTCITKYWISEKINDEIVDAVVSMLSWEDDYRKFKRNNA
jgi:hypothetical protein